jgi:hypothetical protein
MTRPPDPYGNGIIQGLTEIVTASNLIGTSFWEVLYKKFTGEIPAIRFGTLDSGCVRFCSAGSDRGG